MCGKNEHYSLSLVHEACEELERVECGNGLDGRSDGLIGVQEVIPGVELGLSFVSMTSWDRNMRKSRYGAKHTQLLAS